MYAVEAAEVLAAALLLAVLALSAVAVRRRVLQGRGGTIELSLRLRTLTHGRGWVLGLGRYGDEEMRWYRVFSLAPGPRRRLERSELEVRGRREPTGGERLALLQGAVVLECSSGGGPVELAMDARAVPGFLAWLESRPPGAAPRRRS